MGKRAHVVAIPYAAQGHVIPMMETAQGLAANGIKVTFVNTEVNHEKMMKVLSQSPAAAANELLRFAAIPDGLAAGEERTLENLEPAMPKVMPGALAALIERINGTEGEDEVTCVILDFAYTWAFDFAETLKVKRVAACAISTAVLAYTHAAKKMIEDGVINEDGTPLNEQTIQLSNKMPAISSKQLPWALMGGTEIQKIMFHSLSGYPRAAKVMDWSICNSSYELEPGALELLPHLTPIGPLLSARPGQSRGHFWPEDGDSLAWLDQQPPNSTIYVSFGTSAILDGGQFQELALALELTHRPFLWVVRQDLTQDNDKAFPEGFGERVKNRGKLVSWVPQHKVLAHPSVSCFLSHCGWNAALEGISNAVPFLCWPYFAEQFLNQAYITDYWRIGLKFDKDEEGFITKEEIVKKVELIVGDESYKRRVLELQSKAIASAKEGGSSYKNFRKFVDWIKDN